MYKKMSLVRRLALLAFLVGIMSCTTGRNDVPAPASEHLQKIYVSEIKPAGISAEAGRLQVTVLGNLPSPAYTFERFDVAVKGHTIEITPLATYEHGKMVAQVLVPFEEVCTVENLKAGDYAVRVHGRTTVLSGQRMQVKE